MPALIKRQLLCCDIGKQKKDKMKLDLQLVQLPDSVVPLNRFTMLSIVLLSHFVSVCQAIRLDAVLVPQYKIRGQNATLLCKYELEDDEELFSLKWYKFKNQQHTEELEFYRYTPPEEPSYKSPYASNKPYYQKYKQESYANDYNNNNGRRAKTYENDRKNSQRMSVSDTNRRRPYGNYQKPSKTEDIKPKLDGILTWKVPGIKIDMSKSIPQKVVLRKVSFKSTGVYRCEVTSRVRRIKTQRQYERHRYTPDNFRMKESINRMTVVELPKTRPEIRGGLPDNSYKPGDTLNLTCVSAPSNPPATLEWKLNGNSVDKDNIIPQHLKLKRNKLVSSVIGLIMTLEEEHFKDGEIRVNCRGTIRAEFWEKDVENVLFNDQKGFLKVLEVKESQWPSNQATPLTIFLTCSNFGLILLFNVINKHILNYLEYY